jgi:hypothetical protein
MSRACSAAFLAAVFAQQTDKVPVAFVTIDHATLSQPIRVNTSGQDIVRGGNNYQAFPFELTLPGEAENMPAAKLRIDNTDRRIIQAVRGITSPASVTMALALADSPDTTEAEFDSFSLSNVTYDMGMVEGDVTVEDFTSEPFPSGSMTPANFPGLF